MSVIERYDMCVGGTHGGSHVVLPEKYAYGDWVKIEDHEAVVAEMQEYIDQLNKNIANAIHYLSN